MAVMVDYILQERDYCTNIFLGGVLEAVVGDEKKNF